MENTWLKLQKDKKALFEGKPRTDDNADYQALHMMESQYAVCRK